LVKEPWLEGASRKELIKHIRELRQYFANAMNENHTLRSQRAQLLEACRPALACLQREGLDRDVESRLRKAIAEAERG